MCGIVGQVNFNHVPVDEQIIRRMNAQIIHRGPDDDGFYFGQKVAFGSRRLSIIDLSGGHMPLSNEDGTIWITFNGEIYNFLELRQDLIQQGHVFKTRTDTEVIIHLYEQYGIDCLQHLNGMFAFGLWDETRQRLFLARDRIGKKPLVYTHMPWGIAFASEIAALMQNPAVPRELDFEAIDLYMTLMYIPSPFTIYKAVRKLRPAHYLVAEKGQVTIQRYWDIPYHQKRLVSERDAAEELRELLTDAVRRRLISEVPLGAFLSGGVDSSAIVALMSHVTDSPVKTFAIGFESDGFNELNYARKVAKHCGTEHHEFVIEPRLVEVLPGLLRHYGEPFGDDSAVATYFVARLAREFVTVALTGDGGDEVFGGYNRYQSAVDPITVFPDYLRDGAVYAAKAVELHSLRHFMGAFKGVAIGATNLVGELGHPLRAFANRMTFITAGERRRLYSADLINKIDHSTGWMLHNLPDSATTWTNLDKMFYLDHTVYLPDDILAKVDIASMANSLEVRCPILDHRIIEWSAALPPEMKINRNETKRIFRQAVQDLLPPEILSRQKMGFAMPIDEWIRGDLYGMTRDLLTDRTAEERGLFNQTRVREMLKRHKEGTAWFSMQLWLLLIFELWARTIESPQSSQ